MAKSTAAPSKKKPPRRSSALKLHIRDLNLTPIKRYVEIQRARGELVAIGKVDVDLEQMMDRTFLCDRHRCIQWTPHERLRDKQPLIDRSCCNRYNVPVMDLDRQKLNEILPLVKKRLDDDHPLLTDPDQPIYEVDDDFQFVLRTQADTKLCQFVLYDEGRTACAIHKTCLEEGLNPWEWKPIGCSLWPAALVDYETDEGEERYLLTTYTKATAGLFESSGDGDDDHEDHFACLVDQSKDYEPMYKNVEGVLEYMLGRDFVKQLEQVAKKRRAKRSS